MYSAHTYHQEIRKMKLMCEVLEDVQYLEEEKDGKKNLYIEGIFMQGNIKNRNGREYPLPTLQKDSQGRTFFIKTLEAAPNAARAKRALRSAPFW